MDLVPRALTRPVGRLGAAAQNAFEVARFGGLETEERRSPFRIAGEDHIHRLRHYYAGTPAGGTRSGPVLLVPPMMLAADIYDVSPSASAVAMLHRRGIDPWVVDFGSPEHEAGGLERTLADHVVAISRAVDRVAELTGRQVHLGGYSQGGMFAYQVAAYRDGASIASLITFGSPVDTRQGMPFGVPERLASGIAGLFADRIFAVRPLPAWASRAGFQLIDPVHSARNRLEFLRQLHDREALLAREGQRRFLEADGWVAWPGPAMADFLRQFISHNRLLEGGFVVQDRLLTLAGLRMPILAVVGDVDEIAPAAGVRAIREAAPSADVYELVLSGGHFGLVVGGAAAQLTWPAVAGWVRWADARVEGQTAGVGGQTVGVEGPTAGAEAPTVGAEGPTAGAEGPTAGAGRTRRGRGRPPAPPAPIVPIADAAHRAARPDESGDRVGYGLELAGGVANGIVRSAAATARRTVRGARDLTREAAGQLPRLARLEGVGPDTRVSLGSLLAERGERGSDEALFLFDDRAYTAGVVNRRIDDAVRGLIAIGVRQGEQIGVLMGSHPGSLAAIAAISRVGAVAVLLRPGGEIRREASAARVRRIVADPARVAQASAAGVTVHAFSLREDHARGEPGVELTIGAEPVDVSGVRLPRWYRPDPGRASELGFVLFTGEGESLRMSRITNGRWATSALGTASSAALSADDTVYAATPIHHASTLMMSIGGAVAGGARVALASGPGPIEAGPFWDEIRRYGVTVVSYTWTMLHDLVTAAPQPAERHHPVRLFIGSGMPRGLWRRVQERFAPARVLEFYASTETGAILVNVPGVKAGAMGRRLPGSPEVRLAAYDADSDQLMLGHGGFVRSCRTDEVGMLLTRARRRDSFGTIPLRGVFGAEDAWLSTGDLFRRDGDGDYWRMASARELVLTARGPVYAGAVRDALADLPEVDLAVVYGVRPSRRPTELAVAAVSLRSGQPLDATTLTAALAALPAGTRPDVVWVVDEIPVTTWYRPAIGPLRERGLPSRTAWYLDRGGERYRPLTAAAVRRLSAGR